MRSSGHFVTSADSFRPRSSADGACEGRNRLSGATAAGPCAQATLFVLRCGARLWPGVSAEYREACHA